MLMNEGIRQGFLRRAQYHEVLAMRATAAEQPVFAHYHNDLAADYRKAASEDADPAPAVETKTQPSPDNYRSILASGAFWILVVVSIFFWSWVLFAKVHI